MLLIIVAEQMSGLDEQNNQERWDGIGWDRISSVQFSSLNPVHDSIKREYLHHNSMMIYIIS